MNRCALKRSVWCRSGASLSRRTGVWHSLKHMAGEKSVYVSFTSFLLKAQSVPSTVVGRGEKSLAYYGCVALDLSCE